MANNPVVNMFKVKELRSKLVFTLFILAIFRLGSVLTVPGINATLLLQYFEEIAQDASRAAESSFASYMDFFAGGAFEKFSVLMLGVMPYISTQIILQLALVIFPSLKRIAQEEGGQQRVQAWTRIGTIGVCIIQSIALTAWAANINKSVPGTIIFDNKVFFNLLAILTVTTGSMITVWLGDQITAHGIGNGISMIILAGIVARIPAALWKLFNEVGAGNVNLVFAIVAFMMWMVVIAMIVFEQSGERKIPVHYAKRIVGRKMIGNQNAYLPFKINPSGVIPIIFASAFLTFPLQIGHSFASGNNIVWLAKLVNFFDMNGIPYNVLQVVLIVFFAYFYTQVTLNPVEIAKNIRENGGSIPGIRTDRTEEYLQKVLNRLILPGSLFLALIAIVPTILQSLFGFPEEITRLMGGTSLLIVVGVDLDVMAQVEALLKMHHHDGFSKKGLRPRNL